MYIRNYAQHAAPLMEALKGKYMYEDVEAPGETTDPGGIPKKKRKRVKLTPKQAAIDRTPAMREGFQAIKAALIEQVELYLPQPDARWRISTDASDYAIAAVLEPEQDDGQRHPVSFFSRKLPGSKTSKTHKKTGVGQVSWTVREKETYAVVCSLLKFQSWIGNQEVLVCTDHSSILQWYKEDLCTVTGPLGRRGRWHEFLSRFNLVIQYCKGEDNEAPDALSRWAYPAGLSQDVSFRGSEEDQRGPDQCDPDDFEYSQKILRDKYPDAFGEYRTVRSCAVSGCSECVPVIFSDPSDAREALTAARAVAELSLYDLQPHSFHPDAPSFADEDGVHIQTNIRSLRTSNRSIRRLRRQNLRPAASQVSEFAVHRLSPDISCDLDCHVHEVSTLKLPSDRAVLYNDWDSEYANDPVLGSHWPILQREGISGKYRLYMGRVRLDGQICVPLTLLDNIIIATHSYAHPGVYKTHQLIDRKYVFQEPGKDAPVKYSYAKLRKRISVVLAGCQVCLAVKSRTGLQPDTLEAYSVPEYPFSSISVDFCHLPLVSVGSVKYNSVFVIVCRLTGYVMALPCHESVTSAELASLFLTRFVTFFGLPKDIFADNDKVLDAVFFSTFCELSGIEQWRSPVYRARSNGRAKNAVRVVVSTLHTLLEQCGRKRKWVDILPLALWSANDTPGVITGYSPHRLVFGRDPIGFGDHPPVSPDFGCEDAHQFFKRVQNEHIFVRDRLSRIHEQKAQEFFIAHPPQRFEPGDRVWLKVVRRPGENKLDRAWVGPAEVLER